MSVFDPSATELFLGYRVKAPAPPDRAWVPTLVDAVCSVGDCMAKPPMGWIDQWDFNRATCYPTPQAAERTLPAIARDAYRVFAYWLLPFTVVNEERRPIDLDDLFESRLPGLPRYVDSGNLEHLGYDVVTIAKQLVGFGHSPLSCSGMAKTIPVNRYCLVDTEDEAIEVMARFNAEQPEPGTYYGVRVAWKPLGRLSE